MRFCLVFMLLHCGLNLSAQDSTEVNKFARDNDVSVLDASLTIHTAVPTKAMQKAIKNNMGDLGFGVSLLIVSNPFTWGKKDKNSPIRIGAEAGYTYYGRFITDVNINGYSGDYKTSYGIVNLNAILRLRPPTTSSFNPFVDIIAGGNFYISSTSENLSVIETALGIQKLDLGSTSSASFNKGIGFGFSAGNLKPDQARFVFRATYNRGSSIKYVVRNSLVYDQNSNRLVYERGKAPVEYFMVHIGIGI